MSDSPARQARWHLHRGGIVNIWQYAEQTFDFSGGRAIFQGTNGSGKSRTLELLLPLCLDGELRQLGSKGFDTVSIRRLMLDDYAGGPTRIGYAWAELRRAVPGATPEAPETVEYLTCGLGVKASKASQQISDSWRFVTSARIGIDVQLVGLDRVPVTLPQLKEALGPDCVLEEAAFRARVADTIYGVPAARYGDLLHLQRTLRNPDVGLKVLEGQLEQILSDALPPLDPGMIERLATSFEDLESIRENISRLRRAGTALDAFLGSYSSYSHAALHSAGQKAGAARDAAERAARDVRSLATKAEQAAASHLGAKEEVLALEAREAELERSIGTIKELPAYQGLRDLEDRQRVVGSARTTAVAALDAAAAARRAEEHTVDSVVGTLRRLRRDADAATELADQTRERLLAATLDPKLTPLIPECPDASAASVPDLVRDSPDADAPLTEIQRSTPPQLDLERLHLGFQSAAEASEVARSAASERVALTFSLRQRAADIDTRERRLDGARNAAHSARITATEAAGRRNQAAQERTDAIAVWLEKLDTWRRDAPRGADTARTSKLILPDSDALLADPISARDARDSAQRWGAPYLSAAREQVAAVQQRQTAARAGAAEATAALRTVRDGGDSSPPASPYTSPERGTAAGAPFYRLVDFGDGLDADARAGLESALEASGLLTAWVTPDGTVDVERLRDLLAAPPAKAGSAGSTLAAVLVPAVEPGCGVTENVVGRLLAGVELLDGTASLPGGGLSVGVDGRWSAGVLHGQWAKPLAEYVGAGSRAGARTRRQAELEAELEQLAAEQELIEHEFAEATDRLVTWEQHLLAFPDDRPLVAADVAVQKLTETAREAELKARDLRDSYDQSAQRLTASRTELLQAGAAAGLPPEVDALQSAHAAAVQARDSATQLTAALRQRCLGGLTELIEILRTYSKAVDERSRSEGEAERYAAEYAGEAKALGELTDSIGSAAGQLTQQLEALEAERRAVRRDRLPAARASSEQLAGTVARTESQLENKQSDATDREAQAATAAVAFREALGSPGVWAAAMPDTPDVPVVDTEAFELLVASERRGVSDDVVIRNLQTLQTALASSHSITPERQAGILTITVSGEEGPRLVADAARIVRGDLADKQGHLDDQYQQIFATYLLRDLADTLAAQIATAEDLCRRMNDVLDTARSSQGVHVQLEWRPSASLDDATQQALELVRTHFVNRSTEQDDRLRRALTERIETIRDSRSGSYGEILAEALDYRSWYSFTVRVRDTAPDGQPRSRRLRQLSSGETRLISYVTLFAAAAAFYDAVSSAKAESTGPETKQGEPAAAVLGPLRLVLLDEAFERLDDPTIARMLGLLVDLDMDWVITWPSGWGVSPKIPRMHIYDVLRPKSGHGVACTHTTWDGADLGRDD